MNTSRQEYQREFYVGILTVSDSGSTGDRVDISGEVDIIFTTGGTGLGPRDVTPEATKEILDLEIPGLGESMRIKTLDKTPFAILSRSTAGIRSGCLIVNLPGSPKGVEECLGVVMESLPHALEMIRGWKTHKEPS